MSRNKTKNFKLMWAFCTMYEKVSKNRLQLSHVTLNVPYKINKFHIRTKSTLKLKLTHRQVTLKSFFPAV